MKTNKAVAVLIGIYRTLDSSGYQVSMIVHNDVLKDAVCHECIQTFVPHSNFTFAFHGAPGKSENVKMVAEITDDIPFEYVKSICFEEYEDTPLLCKAISDQDINVPDEDKNLHNILAKARGSGVVRKDMSARVQLPRNPKPLRLFGVDIDSQVEESSDERDDILQRISDGADSGHEGSVGRKRAYGERTSRGSDGVLKRQRFNDPGMKGSTTRCLTLEKRKSELWILGCLRCLEPANGDERYLVSRDDGFQWMLRYTTTETIENTEKKCMSTCGSMYWGDKSKCLIARFYGTVQSKSSYSKTFDDFSFSQVYVQYMDTNKERCNDCIRDIVSTIQYIHEGKTHSQFFIQNLGKLRICEKKKFCARITAQRQYVQSCISRYPQQRSWTSQSEENMNAEIASPREKIWFAPYRCMQQTYSYISAESHQLNGNIRAISRYEDFSQCSACVLASSALDSMMEAVNYRQTSSRSSLFSFLKRYMWRK